MLKRVLGPMVGVLVAVSAFATSPKAPLDTAKIEDLAGGKGSYNDKEGVFKVAMPRSDLSITAAGVRLTPPRGRTSWAAFKQAGHRAMGMGDMVLLGDQANRGMAVRVAQRPA